MSVTSENTALIISDITVNEGDGTASFTVTLTELMAGDVSFDWSTGDGTAMAGVHYTASGGTGVTIPAGQLTVVLTVALLDDGTWRGPGDFTVTLSNVTGVVTTGDISATGLILDNDPFKLSTLDGSNGFTVNGVATLDYSGYSVSNAGDINGDGYDDLIIGAYKADPNGDLSGASYVVYGGASLDGGTGTFELSSLDGSNGFVLNGVAASDYSGYSVSSAGDINGDGYDDLIIGAYGADTNGSSSGASYVVFGGAGVGSGGVVELSALDGSNGFVLNGAGGADFSGRSVSNAGDVNGDGYDDLIIGAYGADTNGGNAGASYIVYGGPDIGGGGVVELSSLDGSNGFVLNGAVAGDYSGYSVLSAGDINGDGYDDLLIGAWGTDPNGSFSGASYVVYGGPGIGSGGAIELSSLDGSNGFVLNGVAASDYSGYSVSSAGDINGDGYDDLIIGAYGADMNGADSGASYVVYGGPGIGSGGVVELSALDGSNGFVLNGVTAGDYSGWSVSSAGDVNGDGYDDLIIGARRADPNGTDSGASYVVYGGASVDGGTGTFDLSSLDGSNGFILNGAIVFHASGWSVSGAGDVDGDGFDDLIVGAYGADPNGSDSGASYVIYGSATSVDVTVGTDGDDVLTAASSGGVLIGGRGNDTLAGGVGDDILKGAEGADILTGGGGDDRLWGGSGADVFVFDRDWGNDIIEDFERGQDLIDMTGTGFTWNDFSINITGNNALITDPLGNTVFLNGGANGLDKTDFVFDRPYTLSDITVNEGDGTASFTVTLTGLMAGDVTFDWATHDGTAMAGVHYTASGGTGVTIPAGQLTAVLTVPLLDDGTWRGPGDFTVTLSNVTGAGFAGDISATGLILDNDPFELSGLDGSNGFTLNGVAAGDISGYSVSSAGDINGDGYDDLIVGAPYAGTDSGANYVVYGGPGIGSGGTVELSALDGSNGFVLNGVAEGDWSGWSVSSAGDINGDGYDDLIIGAFLADPNGGVSGASYVVYGGPDIGSGGVIELSGLDGSNGFTLNGVAAGDKSGHSVSNAGDINGDGYDDLIIGAYQADPNGTQSGASYVVYGGPDIGSGGVIELSALDGSNGFVLNGIAADDESGVSVSNAGDINGDGYDDLIIGASRAGPNGSMSGASYVVYGGPGIGSGGTVELSALDGSNGFVLNGVAAGDWSGYSVSSAGDINGDGYGDLIIAAYFADPNGIDSGASYVVYGGPGIGSGGVVELSALDGSNGFVLNGVAAYDMSGVSVSSAGDINGDGYDDLLIGAPGAGPTGGGASYVVYGGTSVDGGTGTFELSDLDGSNGFVLNGVAYFDQSGHSVSSAGDVNGDGFDDLIIGAHRAGPNGTYSGESYVVYGSATSVDLTVGTDGDDVLVAASSGGVLIGGRGNDTLAGGVGDDILKGAEGADILTGGGGDDRLWGGSGADVFVFDGGWGNDIIEDFENGVDLIDMTGTGFTWDDLSIDITGNDALITDPLGNTVFLNGGASGLDAGDFLF